MTAEIRHADPSKEFPASENCLILELANDASDPDVSIARARVLPGQTTAWHRVKGIDERYVIIRGKGRVEVGDLPPTVVGEGDVVRIPADTPQRIANVGDEDLMFLAICSPRFVPSAYVAGLLLLMLLPSAVLAQTPTGQEMNATVSGYTYTEPSATTISIHGPKVGGEYTATLSLNKQRHWFTQGNVRGMIGAATYTGWCSPFLIRPNNSSPNGYELDIGDRSPCSENGDKDWYLEGRALAGKDVIGKRWTYSPYAGVGLRHLSNGTTGTAGYRTDKYLYVPAGVTARTNGASRHALALNVEVDPLIRGWQKTRDSALGGGNIPATPTAPAFTINGFSDVSFSQHAGWAIRASARYQVTRHWSMEPYDLHWHVSASPVSDETATFTVNGITAREQLGAYEPLNFTREFGVKLGFHF